MSQDFTDFTTETGVPLFAEKFNFSEFRHGKRFGASRRKRWEGKKVRMGFDKVSPSTSRVAMKIPEFSVFRAGDSKEIKAT